MTMTDATKTTNKALPFPGTWTAAPNDVLRNYWVHPEFSPTCFAIYMHLLDRFNAKEGYAYPTQDQIAETLLLSRRIVNTHLSKLKKLNLISILDSPYGGINKVYVPIKPLKSIDEIETAFPEVTQYRAKCEEARRRDRKSRASRKALFEAKLREAHEKNQ